MSDCTELCLDEAHEWVRIRVGVRVELDVRVRVMAMARFCSNVRNFDVVRLIVRVGVSFELNSNPGFTLVLLT